MIHKFIERIIQFLKKLQSKYGRPRKLSERLEEKWGNDASAVQEPEQHFKLPPQELVWDEAWDLQPLFLEDADYNERVLGHIYESLAGLRREFEESTQEDGNKQAYLKCIDQFFDKLKRLIEKRDFEDAGSLAGKLKKIFTSTLLKMWEYQECSSLIQSYMQEWGISGRSFPAGYHLTDDDWEYLDELSIEFGQQETMEPSRNYEVIQMEQPIFYIAYSADEEVEYEYIAGRCRYYRYTG